MVKSGAGLPTAEASKTVNLFSIILYIPLPAKSFEKLSKRPLNSAVSKLYINGLTT